MGRQKLVQSQVQGVLPTLRCYKQPHWNFLASWCLLFIRNKYHYAHWQIFSFSFAKAVYVGVIELRKIRCKLPFSSRLWFDPKTWRHVSVLILDTWVPYASGVQAICTTSDISSRPPTDYKTLNHVLGFKWHPRILQGYGRQGNKIGGKVWPLPSLLIAACPKGIGKGQDFIK